MTMGPTRLQGLGRALIMARQGLCSTSACIYSWGKVWVAERQLWEAIWQSGQQVATRLQTSAVKIEALVETRLFWFRLTAIVFTLIAGELKYAEPDSWLGRIFASRFEAVKIGYQTLLQKQPLTRHDTGFQEILELAFASAQYMTDYIATKHVGPIETIIYTGQSGLAAYGWNSTLEHMFRAALTIRLEDRNGKGVTARLGYTERDLKDRFFVPILRWWATFAFRTGTVISVLLLIPTRRGPA
jgi:hypothetical protein